MNTSTSSKPIFPILNFRNLSIRQRLPLVICILLLIVITGFSLAAYYTVRNAAMEMGKERLRSLTNELGSMLSQSTGTMVSELKKAARNDTLIQYAQSGNTDLEKPLEQIFEKIKKDSTFILLDLRNKEGKRLTSYSEASSQLQQRLQNFITFPLPAAATDSGSIGNMYAIGKDIYFPIITTIGNIKKPDAWLICWRLLVTTPGAVEQISNLMGKGALLYIGNTDGTLWTDMIKPVPKPPVSDFEINKFFNFKDNDGNKIIAASQLISTSYWRVLVEFSRQTLLESATRFLRWIIIIGAIILIVAIFFTWYLSNNITRPLNKLTTAAIAISNGNYSLPVELNRKDEIGKLANAFEIMKHQVQFTQEKLENKVQQRTAQLEDVNKELEAFSYSVSHDLRAPLRGIIGFTSILEDKYTNQLDDEAKRLTGIIRKNTVKMGALIDDLLCFSKYSRQEMVKVNFSTRNIIDEIITELDTGTRAVQWQIEELSPSFGDINSLRQVWVNLISNALKYSGKVATPKIEIGSYAEADQMVFFIKDNGVGFDTKYMDKLFKVFQRLHSTKEFEGTGVGLAIVEKIISRHGGRVWASAEKDNGAAFFFSLPVAKQG